jgi:hypothetical protein
VILPNRVDRSEAVRRHLVLADVWYPAGSAADGQPVPVQRGTTFRAVAVPAARATVFTFAPASYAWGQAVSLAVLAGLALLGVVVAFARLLQQPGAGTGR